MTPQENLEEAGRLLDFASSRMNGQKEPAVADIINLANSRITLALALNAVPLVGELRDDLTELRGPAKLT